MPRRNWRNWSVISDQPAWRRRDPPSIFIIACFLLTHFGGRSSATPSGRCDQGTLAKRPVSLSRTISASRYLALSGLSEYRLHCVLLMVDGGRKPGINATGEWRMRKRRVCCGAYGVISPRAGWDGGRFSRMMGTGRVLSSCCGALMAVFQLRHQCPFYVTGRQKRKFPFIRKLS